MRASLGVAALMTALVAVAAPASALAAMNAYLYIDGVKGDATDAGHQGWIEVSSFQWGVGRGIGSPMGGSADRESSAPSVSEIVVTKNTDKASPLLSKCAATGCRYGSAILEMRKAGGGDQMVRYALSNLMVSSYHLSSGGDRPTESLSFSFTKIEMKAAPDQAGSIQLNSSRSNASRSAAPGASPP
jgi:type VI secretion system secreted protein Hcp